MSEPALFVLIRDGRKRFFEDRWANAFLYRELLWGPEALEQWLVSGEEFTEFDDDFSGGVVVNFDTMEMIWTGSSDSLDHPQTERLYSRLLDSAWPGFTVKVVESHRDFVRAAGESYGSEDEDNYDEYEDSDPERCLTVHEAAAVDDDSDADDDEGDDYEHFDEETKRAWVTLIGKKGPARHRNLEHVSLDLIKPTKLSLQSLNDLPSAEVPAEKLVTEGMWIDGRTQEIGFWGASKSLKVLPEIQKNWRGWNVRWAAGGYAEQCQVSGQKGIPMTPEQSLAEILPTVLSTKRLDMSAIVGAIGGQLKSTAIKAVGCLVFVLCIPILIYGYFAEQFQASAIAAFSLVVVSAVVFKLMEGKVKRKFMESGVGAVQSRDEQAEQGRAPVVGPLDTEEREQEINRLLGECGLPDVETIRPHVDEDSTLEGLL